MSLGSKSIDDFFTISEKDEMEIKKLILAEPQMQNMCFLDPLNKTAQDWHLEIHEFIK